MKVTYAKLERYCREQRDFQLDKKDEEVTMTFAPTFPEARDKGESADRRIMMHGKFVDGFVIFDQVEVEDETGHRFKDTEEAELTYGGWLGYIEENF